MGAVEYVCIFVRASPERLRAAERFVLALPQLLGDALLDVDLRYQSDATLLGVFIRMEGERLARAKCERLVFWTARAGGRAMPGASMSPEDRDRIGTWLSRPSKSLGGVEAKQLLDATGAFFAELGAPAERRRSLEDRPQLVLDVAGRGWEGVRWNAAESRLFVAAPLAPPVGDEIPLLLRVPGGRSVDGRCTVVEVRPKLAAGPGQPAGYTLRLEGPPAPLVELLSRTAGAPMQELRSAPRYRVTAPVKVIPSPERTRAVIEYANDRELAEDFVSNLSEGGAFIRSLCPVPIGTSLELELRLPNGADLRTAAVVAFVNSEGMGVQFHLDPVAEAVLDSAIAHISGQRRALVVDDDALVQRMYSDALRERGYEVLVASNAAKGIQILSDELLSLDILLTDMLMPGMNGEDFVRLIRKTGGESELAIVCVTGQHEGGLEQRLESAGADAVLDKALGPELIAQAADAVLERKRMLALP